MLKWLVDSQEQQGNEDRKADLSDAKEKFANVAAAKAAVSISQRINADTRVGIAARRDR